MRVLLIVILLVMLIVASIYAYRQRRRAKGNPLLWLSRKERQEFARERVKREQEQYDLQHQQDLIDIINSEVRKGNPL